MDFPFEYRKFGNFTYHVLSDPRDIKDYLMKWIMREWVFDHNQTPDENWTVAWMERLPRMEFTLEIIRLAGIRPNPDLWRVEEFRTSLKERADEREEAMLRGVSIEPLLVDRDSFELLDGYTRYTVLNRYAQKEAFAYLGTTRLISA